MSFSFKFIFVSIRFFFPFLFSCRIETKVVDFSAVVRAIFGFYFLFFSLVLIHFDSFTEVQDADENLHSMCRSEFFSYCFSVVSATATLFFILIVSFGCSIVAHSKLDRASFISTTFSRIASKKSEENDKKNGLPKPKKVIIDTKRKSTCRECVSVSLCLSSVYLNSLQPVDPIEQMMEICVQNFGFAWHFISQKSKWKTDFVSNFSSRSNTKQTKRTNSAQTYSFFRTIR